MSEPRFEWPLRPADWELLVPGADVMVVKRTHDAVDVVQYPGRIVPTNAAAPWVEVEAIWTAGTVVQGPLTFETDDILREFFSWKHPYNAFAVYAPTHQLKGWYANVTYPSWVERSGNELRLLWQDLWLDVVADVSGEIASLDEDELSESGLADRDAGLHRTIVTARDELTSHLKSQSGPFVSSLF